MSIAVIHLSSVEAKRYRDVPIDVRAIRRNVIGGGHLDDQVRLARASSPRRISAAGARPRALPSGIPCFTHCLDQRDLAVLEPPLVPEWIRRDLRLPWRHETRLRNRGDDPSASSPRPDKRAARTERPPGPMAGSAVIVDDRRDLLVERDGLRASTRQTQGDEQTMHRAKQRSSRVPQKTKASAPRMLRGVLTSST